MSGRPILAGQTVVVIGGSSGIGLETARLARDEGADVILAARNPERLEQAAREVGATRTVAFDVTDPAALDAFFAELPDPIDHVMLTGGGPYYALLAELDFEEARREVEAHLWAPLRIARLSAGTVRPGGTLLFIGGTGGRRPTPGFTVIGAMTAAMPAFGDQLDERREELRRTLPIGRVVGPADVAALAVHLMTNTAVTGAVFDIDGGQQLVGA